MTKKKDTLEDLLTPEQVAQMIPSRQGGNVSTETIRQYTTKGVRVNGKQVYLEAVLFPGVKRYRQADVEQFLQNINEAAKSNGHEKIRRYPKRDSQTAK